MQLWPLHGGYGVEDAGEPVTYECEGHHQEQQHCRTVLGKRLDTSDDPQQPEQPGGLQHASHCHSLGNNQLSLEIIVNYESFVMI